MSGQIADILLALPAVLWAISFHEFCHGWVAYQLGDPTARDAGRLTLNPLAHFDVIGAIMLLLFHFGWAKPVPIDPRYFGKPRRDMVLVSVAGVAGNIFTAFVVGLILRFFPGPFMASPALGRVMILMVYVNVGLAVFNLIPIPPLDGSKLIYPLLPRSWMKGWFYLERYGMIVLLLLVAVGAIGAIMRPVMYLFLRLILA
ncbi:MULTISPECIES: site-2 protease family protein [Dethiosulfovibrio]|uniref:Site-2 protease family protein n=2 Tax=Dethiosulfovibrio TaxID=47054 RepID=A0ABS9EP01_9BACT|nr:MULTISPECIES: site-2 protease family protein [Dethiosulfovibrio]MCF4113432.1 site-2 protease family protein [Dethiosulfovibrio russensis]MCF4141902.1 site-2 protease family protein [Dethiosulfovibrio marinus]MCF4144056.1 site-2 protease family protein [Dethiosulfovibrio acidaminovorans]